MASLKDRFRRVAAYLRRQRPVYEFGEKRGLWRSQTSETRMDIDADSTDSQSKVQEEPEQDPAEDPKDILAEIWARRPSSPGSRGAWDAHFLGLKNIHSNEDHDGREVSEPHQQLEGDANGKPLSRRKAKRLKKTNAGKVKSSSSYKVTVDDAAHHRYMDTLQARAQRQWKPRGSFHVWRSTEAVD
ncbi:hypothetical protein MMC10_010847 [Thelotrema lepadinum]|nr:hypothetical protein [Thelotrema lepadinum]